MTVQEAIEKIKYRIHTAESVVGVDEYNEAFEDLEMAIKALEEVEKLRFENRALKNRCGVLTRGVICSHCPIDCSNRTVDFRGNKDAD